MIDRLPDEVDVLIVGCGPAGLTLAAQLAAFPEIKTRIVEQKPGPLQLGQADGDRLPDDGNVPGVRLSRARGREAYWVNETVVLEAQRRRCRQISFAAAVSRTSRTGCREFPHVILNQARVHDFYLDLMRSSPEPAAPDYSRRMLDLKVASARRCSHPVTVRFERIDPAHRGRDREA